MRSRTPAEQALYNKLCRQRQLNTYAELEAQKSAVPACCQSCANLRGPGQVVDGKVLTRPGCAVLRALRADCPFWRG